MIPCAVSIAGSDSSGGAGVQADIKTMTALGVYAETVITALTAQNTQGVQGVVATGPEFVTAQMDSVFSDIRPHAVKIGMLPNDAVVTAVAGSLCKWKAHRIVLDPVMVATSGAALSEDAAVRAMVDHLIPLAEVVTPNVPEAEVLANRSVTSKADMEAAAYAICAQGAKAVLIKGGHLGESADDVLLMRGCAPLWLSAPRVETVNTHGTGCTLSSAIAAYCAKGFSLEDAVRAAKQYLTGALMHDLELGSGYGPVNHMWQGVANPLS